MPQRATSAGSNWCQCRAHGLFPPGDQLLEELAGTPGLHPFEKHLAGELAPSEPLPEGGWATGDAAAQHGMDLRLFYRVNVFTQRGAG